MNSEVGEIERGFVPSKQYIAYFDILGYEQKIRDHGGAVKLANFLSGHIKHYKALVNQLNNTTLVLGDEARKIDIKMKVFSDNFILCSTANWKALATFVIYIQRGFVANNVFMRGSLCYGELYFEDEFVCGQGIIDAYKIENEVAIFPRIVIDDSYVKAAICSRKLQKNNTISENEAIQWVDKVSSYTVDFDGNKFLDYLKFEQQYYLDFKNDGYTNAAVKNLLNEHKKHIISNISSTSNKRILQKYNWCKYYHNNFCKAYNYRKYSID